MIDRLHDAGEPASISAHVLEVFAHGRRNRPASQEALARADAAELAALPPVEASWIRLYRAVGHWLHGDTDWMRREFSDDQGNWVRLVNPIALSMPGVIDVLEGRSQTYRSVDEAQRARSYLLTFEHALTRNHDALREEVDGVRAHLDHDPTSGAAFPILCSHAVLSWALDDHDLTRRMLVEAGAPATPYAAIVHHLGRLLGCEDDMLQRQPDAALIRNIGNVVLDHIDEVQSLIDHAW